MSLETSTGAYTLLQQYVSSNSSPVTWRGLALSLLAITSRDKAEPSINSWMMIFSSTRRIFLSAFFSCQIVFARKTLSLPLLLEGLTIAGNPQSGQVFGVGIFKFCKNFPDLNLSEVIQKAVLSCIKGISNSLQSFSKCARTFLFSLAGNTASTFFKILFAELTSLIMSKT